MKQNLFSLMVFAGVFTITSMTYAQDNNYITSKYDFIPGEKVIFFDDFTSESVGDFPAQWLTNGSGEIVTSQKFAGRWFNMTKMGYYIPEAKEDYTDNFTIEFDFVPMNSGGSETMYGLSLYLLTGSLNEPGGGGEPGDAGFQISLDYDNLGWKNWSLVTEQRFNGTVTFPFRSNEKYHIAIWVQKQRVRLYANENKVLDVPRAIPTGSKPNILRFDLRDEAIPLISNFRIAAGLPDMRNRLLNDGKIISYGILFDVNSDKLKPESYSTLKEIANILNENPAIRIMVIGHTDSDGDDDLNLDLSKRRAISVKNELVNKFSVDGARLETNGKGESEPLEDNSSTVNKAKNRRVEFINLKTANVTNSSTKNSALINDIDGNSYKTVTLGKQIWMAENLKTTKYNDGRSIPLITDSAAWEKTETNAYCFYKNDESKYKNTYGVLYNWYTVSSGKLCPSGWHVPNNDEWGVLQVYLQGSEGTDNEGGMLKESGTAHWESPNSGATNETGFSALPGGGRGSDGTFNDFVIKTVGKSGSWWTSSAEQSGGTSWMSLNYDYKGLAYGGGSSKGYGISVRCIKD